MYKPFQPSQKPNLSKTNGSTQERIETSKKEYYQANKEPENTTLTQKVVIRLHMTLMSP